ncbi:MAG: putative ATPase, partial [Myxococcota bacterium]
LGVALRERGPTLLILDSFEHLIAHAEQTIGRWLAAAPALQLLVTSRVPLRLRGEQLLTVDVLPPKDAAALFIHRAQASGAHIDAETPELAELVSLLDGLPLAIELAATRARMLSPADLRARLSSRFDLLTSRSQQLPARQRTLRATLAWSWALLSPAEQAVLAQCSIFEQGFSLDAAAAVIVVPDDSGWLEDILAELIDKSLLRRLDDGEGTRLGMLHAVQHFVAEKRTDPAPTQQRHAAWFARLGAPTAIAALHGRQGHVRWKRLEAESANIIAALQRAPPEHLVPLARAAAEIFERRGPLLAGAAMLAKLPQDAWLLSRRGFLLQHAGRIEEARACYDAALARAGPEEAPEIRLRRANLQLQRGEIAAAEETYRALIALDRTDRTPIVARLNLSLICRRRGERDAAAALCRAALDGSQALGDRTDTATAQLSLGNIALEQGIPTEASARYQEALKAYREVGAARGEGTVLRNLGTLALNQGRIPEARAHYTAALVLYRSLGQAHGIGSTLGNIGKVDEHEGKLADARARYEEALALHRECGFRYGTGHWLEGLSALAITEGRAADAVASAREAIEAAAGMPRLEGAFRATLARALAAAGRPDDARAEADVALAQLEAGGFTLQQAGALAARAAAALAADQPDDARSDLDEAERRMLAAGADQSSEVGALITAIRQQLPTS